MKTIELSISQFEYVNDEDCFGIFLNERNTVYDALTLAEQSKFHHHVFDKQQTDLLYKKFKKIVVKDDDVLYGINKDGSEVLISKAEGLYESAENIIKIGLK
ncbi:hypothetical protein [Cytophaga aurantiaca]|uniref:hypothetical protein n=1 Tax=Cytophaga aurantiaca TaxID=29530 RepID=UPI00037C5C95|nr:hypothetical protein [Cytophaga aurantiaca]